MTIYQRALFRLRAMKLEALYADRAAINRRIDALTNRQFHDMRVRMGGRRPMATPKPVTQVPEFLKQVAP